MANKRKAALAADKMMVKLIARDRDKNLDLTKALTNIHTGSGTVIELPAAEAQAEPFELDQADGLRLVTEYPFLYKEVKGK